MSTSLWCPCCTSLGLHRSPCFGNRDGANVLTTVLPVLCCAVMVQLILMELDNISFVWPTCVWVGKIFLLMLFLCYAYDFQFESPHPPPPTLHSLPPSPTHTFAFVCIRVQVIWHVLEFKGSAHWLWALSDMETFCWVVSEMLWLFISFILISMSGARFTDKKTIRQSGINIFHAWLSVLWLLSVI